MTAPPDSETDTNRYARQADRCSTLLILCLGVAGLGLVTRGYFIWGGTIPPVVDSTTRALMFAGSVGIFATFAAGLYFTHRWQNTDAE